MSVGRNLQEMENVVTKGAAPAEPMQSGNKSGVATPGQTGAWEDLGGPTPENYRPDDDSAKLQDPATTLAQVKDVVNAKASAAEAPHSSATTSSSSSRTSSSSTRSSSSSVSSFATVFIGSAAAALALTTFLT